MPAPKFKAGEKRHPKAGRKKGSLNKRTVEFQETLIAMDFNPAAALIFCYREAVDKYKARVRVRNLTGAHFYLQTAAKTANDIAQYTYPRKKAIEHSGHVGIKTFADFIEAAENEEKNKKKTESQE